MVTVAVGGQVVAVDDGPVQGTEDTASTIDVRANDVWVGDGTPVVSITTNPAHGTATVVSGGDDDGKIVYTPTASWYGNDSFTYTLTDVFGHTSTGTVTLNVAWVNDALFDAGALYQSEEGEAINYSFDTPNATESLAWTADGLPAGLSINSSTGHITGRTLYSAAPGQDTSYSVTVTATAAGGDTYCQVLPWNVIDVNRIPWQDDHFSWSGEVVAILVGPATDALGDALTYSFANLPPGVTLDTTSGTLDGFTDPNDSAGVYHVTETVTGGGATDTRNFTWTVLAQGESGGFMAMNDTVTPIDDVVIVGGGGSPFLVDYRVPAYMGSTPIYKLTIEGPATFDGGATEITAGATSEPDGQVELIGGGTIIPIDASTTANDIVMTLWQVPPVGAPAEIKKFDTTALKVSFRSGLTVAYNNNIRKPDTPTGMKDRIAPYGSGNGVTTWVAIYFGMADGSAVNGNAALKGIVLKTGVFGGARNTKAKPETVDNGIALLMTGDLAAATADWKTGFDVPLDKLDERDNFVMRVAGDSVGILWNHDPRPEGYQTQPGKSGQLTVRVWGDAADDGDNPINSGTSEPFSVAAIPVQVNMLTVEKIKAASRPRKFEGQDRIATEWGAKYTFDFVSDSGEYKDLDKVSQKEMIVKIDGTGYLKTAPVIVGSWAPTYLDPKGPEKHTDFLTFAVYTTGRPATDNDWTTILNEANRLLKAGGASNQQQYFIFYDFRTGGLSESADDAAPKIERSGYKIKYEIDTTVNPILFTVTKTAAAVQGVEAGGITAAADHAIGSEIEKFP